MKNKHTFLFNSKALCKTRIYLIKDKQQDIKNHVIEYSRTWIKETLSCQNRNLSLLEQSYCSSYCFSVENDIKHDKTPSRIAFVLDSEGLVFTYIEQFHRISDAKANLERKIKTGVFVKHPKRKKGPGVSLDLEKIWLSSNLGGVAEIEEKTLEASIKASGRKIRKRFEVTKDKDIEESESKQFSGDAYKSVDELVYIPSIILIDEQVKGLELITNYVDMILCHIFHDPQKKLIYIWLNKATETSGDRYPDGGSYINRQRKISCSTGFCEVKADYMESNTLNTHFDLLRLCIVGKGTIDNEDVENVVLLQAVGHRIVVYMYQQHDGGFYAAFEVNDIEISRPILELPGFVMKLDNIKRLINLYELYCATEKDKTNFKRKIPSPNINEMNTIINIREPKKVKTSLEF